MIGLQGISRDFLVGDQTVHALVDINLDISAGEYVSVMGPSGSGKSTLLNIIALLDTPSSDHYMLNQEDVTANRQLNLVDGAVVKDTRKSPLAHGAN